MQKLSGALHIPAILLIVLLPPAWSASIIYSYDIMNRLTGVQFDSGIVIAYTYDLAGNRLTKQVTVPATAPAEELSRLGAPRTSSGIRVIDSQGRTVLLPSPLPEATLPFPHYAVQAPPEASVAPERGEAGELLSYALPPPGATSTPPGPPLPPDRLGAVGASGRVALLWQAAAADITGFVIQRQVQGDSGEFVEVARILTPNGPDAAGVRWTDPAVQSGQTYRYRVAAYNAAGLSPFTVPLEVRVE